MKIDILPVESIHCKGTSRPPNEVASLAKSISEEGLLHPLTVHYVNNEPYLIAGETRLAAIKSLVVKEVACIAYEVKDGLNKTQLEDKITEIRIHENLFRYNLPWYEQVSEELKLHELRQKQFGKAKRGGKGERGGWGVRDTARELNMAVGAISQDLNLAEAIIHDPNLKKIKDKGTATKLIREHAKRAWQEVSSAGPSQETVDQVYLGDSLDVLGHLQASVFDAVITDPPWLRFYRDDKLESDENTLKVFKEVFRVMKQDSFLYCFLGTSDLPTYYKELPRLGFKVQEMTLIWAKQNVITHGKRSWEYARDYEPILLAVKGSPALTISTQVSAIFTHPVVPSMKLVHPNEKPLDLIKKIINHCTYEGALILDPFSGSGVVPLAAKELGRHYIAIEREKKYYDVINRRLECQDKNT